MNDEIKEILDSLKDILDDPKGLDEMPNGNLYKYDRSYELEQDEIKILLDYITNLQQENERLKVLNKEYKYELGLNEFEHTTIIDTSYKEDYKDYKSRCEKALKTLLFDFDTQDTIFKAINILQNGSEDNDTSNK